ncbi:MAG TPA: cupin domain-containing protein [Pirellulales bacterium]
MKVNPATAVPSAPVEMPGAVGCRVRWLIGRPEGAPNFAMREFEVQPGGYTPKHSHDYEHEVYILDGAGVVLEGDAEHPVGPGSVVYVAPNEVHQFRNTGDAALKFLCLIPHIDGVSPPAAGSSSAANGAPPALASGAKMC